MNSAYALDVAGEVRAEMGRQRISQTALADRLEASQAYVSRRLTGEVSFSVADLDTIAGILEVPIERFLEPPLALRSQVEQQSSTDHRPAHNGRRRVRRRPSSPAE